MNHVRPKRPTSESLLTPRDVEVAFRWMFDVRDDLLAIRTLLEERYGEEEDSQENT